MTIYPSGDDELDQIVAALMETIGDEKGPYILSDIRYGGSPIYFRYGGFVPIAEQNTEGKNIECIPNVDGFLVEDHRAPFFINPSSRIHRPKSVDQAYRAYMETLASPLDDYQKIEPIYFSNGGGVYFAKKTNGDMSLLKEARAYAGLDQRHEAAPIRLNNEWTMLNLLHGSNTAPTPIRRFKAWEHRYIEMEYLDGTSINNWMAEHYPTSDRSSSSRDVYKESIIKLGKKIIDGVTTIHSFGYAHGDIHPSNIIVINDGRDIKFIDFESARQLNSQESTTGNAMGYLAPAHFTPEEADWFGVSRVLASLFYPTSAIAMLSPDYWPKMLNRLEREYGIEARDLVTAVDNRYPSQNSITPVFFTPHDPPHAAIVCFPENRPVTKMDLLSFSDKLIDGIQAARHSTPGFLYPSDVSQGNRLAYANIKTGAAGVFLTLCRAKKEIPKTDIPWLTDAVYRDSERADVDFGLFTGITGVAMLDAETDHDKEAEFLLERSLQYGRSASDLSLESGLAGLSLALLAYGHAKKNDSFTEQGLEICNRLNTLLFDVKDAATTKSFDSNQGLLKGWSGLALLNIAASQTCNDKSSINLDMATACIKNDLCGNFIDDFGVRGTLDQYNRSLPYLEKGSAGILIAVCALRRAAHDDSLFADEWDSLIKACSSTLYAFSGLYHGRAGIIAALNLAAPWIPNSKRILDLHWKSFNQFGLIWHNNLYLPGESYLRLSCDYSTGSAGVISAVNSLIGKPWSFLPVVCPNDLFNGNTIENSTKYERRRQNAQHYRSAK